LIFTLQRKGYNVSQDTLTSLGILTAAELIPRFPALFMELGEMADMRSEVNVLSVTERMEGYIACYESFDSLKAFGQDKKLVAEIDELINVGAFNAFFVLGGSIGFIGHILDEKRLGMPLHRHPWDDILYDVKRPEEA